VLALAFTVWAVLAAGFTGVALFRLARRAAPERPVRRRPHVLLLRPVDAPTPLELEHLSAPIDYAGELTHTVLSPYRPRLASANVGWLPSDPLTGNRKVGHLTYGLAVLRPSADTVVLAVDADVRVDGALVAGLVDALSGGAALASAPPRPDLGQGLAARAVRGLLVQSHHAFEALEVMSVGAKAICGKALALTPAAVEALSKLGDCIGEDLELSTVLHARGLGVALANAPALVPQGRPQAAAVLARFTRWMQVLQAHRPSLFPTVPLFFAPTPALMVAASVLGSTPLALALVALVGARIALANRLDRRPGLRFEWLLAELLLWAAWLQAVRAGGVVTWRGRTFTLSPGGRMEVRPLGEPREAL
jgi:hypothetical protein